MAPLDWVFATILLASFLLGAWRGLVYEVLSVLSWVAAFVLAQMAAPNVAQWLPMGQAPQAMKYAVAFGLVFIVVVFAGGLLAWLTSKLVAAVGLRPIDRVLGAGFGLVRGALLLMAIAIVMNMTPMRRDEWWTQSKAAGMSTAAVKQLKPVLPERFGRYLLDYSSGVN
jgi:membrane protein required for colicin V production